MTANTMPVTLIAWRPMRKNTLLGFATVRLGRSLTIKDVGLHRSGDRAWAGMPAKPMLGQDGHAKMNETGKIQYVSILEWASKEASDRFSEAVFAAVEAEHEGATA